MMPTTNPLNRRCTFDRDRTYRQLQKAWRKVCLLCGLAVLGCFGWLYGAWRPGAAVQWLAQAAAVNAYVLWLLWRGLGKNHPPDQRVLRPGFGWANGITLLRGGLIGGLAGFVFQPPPVFRQQAGWLVWLPGVLYGLAAMLDYWDGYVARVTGSETRLGAWLDTEIDALGLLVASLLAIGYGRLPVFYIAVGSAYYLFQGGIRCRRKKGRPVLKLAPQPARRMMAGFHMGLVTLALLPVFSKPVMTMAAAVFMIPFLSGFFRDWRMVCGRFEVGLVRRTRRDRLTDVALTRFFPVLLRLVVGGAGIFFIVHVIAALVSTQEAVSGMRLYLTKSFAPLEVLVMVGAALMAALGIITRIAALLIGVVLAGALTTWHSPPGLFFLFSCAAALMLTGSGPLSIWHPEDRLLLQRQG